MVQGLGLFARLPAMRLYGNWIDSHCHLADPRWDATRTQVLAAAKDRGIGYFVQGGVGPEDWLRQQELKKQYSQILPVFGLHPYWVAAHDEEECEEALNLLPPFLPGAVALGELGLDFRPHIMKDSQERQFACFEEQLQLAQVSDLPVVLHLVQAHEEALRAMDLWGLPQAGGLVHSFNGSAHKAKELLARGLYLSVGGPVCRPDNVKLHQAVREIPLEKLLIETDSPDQPPPQHAHGLNPPESLWEVAKTIGHIKELDPAEILDISTTNCRRLLKMENP